MLLFALLPALLPAFHLSLAFSFTFAFTFALTFSSAFALSFAFALAFTFALFLFGHFLHMHFHFHLADHYHGACQAFFADFLEKGVFGVSHVEHSDLGHLLAAAFHLLFSYSEVLWPELLGELFPVLRVALSFHVHNVQEFHGSLREMLDELPTERRQATSQFLEDTVGDFYHLRDFALAHRDEVLAQVPDELDQGA